MLNIETSEETKEFMQALKDNPELIRLLKAAATLKGYQMDVAVQTSIALAQQGDNTAKKNGAQ